MNKPIWQPTLPPGRDYKATNLTELRHASAFIYQVGESPILRAKAAKVPVKEITNSVTQEKIKYVKNCLLRYTRLTHGKGRGLAAPQVGIHERFFVAYIGRKPDVSSLSVFINPDIEEISDVLYRYNEACMSANSLVAPVVRPAWIRFSYYNEAGEKQVWQQRDTTSHFRMLNRVFEHEIDHLDGVINIDLVPSASLTFESFPGKYKRARFEKVM
jgi:peptide deformylase